MYDMFCLFIGPYEDTRYLDPKTLFKEYKYMVQDSKYELKKDGIVYDIDFDQDQVTLKFKRLGKKVLELSIEDDQGLWHIKTKDLDKEGKMVFKKFINSIEELYIVPYFLFFRNYLKDKDFQIINCKIYNLESRTFDEFNQKISSKDLLKTLDKEKSVLVSMTMDTGLNIDGSIGLIQGSEEALKELKDDIVKFKEKMEKEIQIVPIKYKDLEYDSYVIIFNSHTTIEEMVDIFNRILKIEELRNVEYSVESTKIMFRVSIYKGNEFDIGGGYFVDNKLLLSFNPFINTPRKFIMPYTYEVLKMIETWYNGKRVL